MKGLLDVVQHLLGLGLKLVHLRVKLALEAIFKASVNGRRDGGGYVAVGGGVSGGGCWDVQVAGVDDAIN